jgi:transcription initiation factor TFIIIB Brf1 subunit/transcription initiation factor TFIIB
MKNYTLTTTKVRVVMKWESIKDLSPAVFRRLTGVKDTTFIEMVAILQKVHDKKKQLGGRPNKLCIADMLLMTLEYLREYRTYLHIGKSYSVSESNAYKIIKWVEDTLIKSRSSVYLAVKLYSKAI